MESVYLSLVMMFLIGVGVSVDKLAATYVQPLPLLLVRSVLFLILIAIATLLAGQFPRVFSISPQGMIWIGVSSVIGAAALTAYYAALQKGTASMVGTVIAAAPLVTYFLALILLRENFSWVRLLGVIITAAGLILVARGG